MPINFSQLKNVKRIKCAYAYILKIPIFFVQCMPYTLHTLSFIRAYTYILYKESIKLGFQSRQLPAPWLPAPKAQI